MDNKLAAQAFKRKYNYHCIDDDLVVFSVPTRIFRRCFGDRGFNTFVVCADGEDLMDEQKNYQLCDRQRFRFRQFRPIYSQSDSDNGLRIVPYVNGVSCARMDFLHFVTNFLDVFAVINNEYKFSQRKTFNTIRTLKIYRKIA
ncbi:hypothetical protein [Mamestra configurata nucleopolyhedrovirus B]|uniref:Mabr_orf83 n=2 Tax=Alphabaculovirus TaxID=558016 RepID=I3XM99_NPVMB|nr:hypothetical protein McnBVgp090 [Mamestra configurata nucleopolyhedrovirus B]YP_009011146.1 hypothetical protein [Mamestra brassicae multiple nucleopolyhedrovirus]WNA17463.1 hypothetical protein [Alphabaculovirus mabrassicae]AAM95077.1 hypothetical protein [Mamestra configurata nucleopolyhedrovirus B]AFL64932.1 hypothetical protein [Mamestra brassicae multiple nucleopolyhedrovirus]AFP95802.1 Mabr_orf83 [Mamestra brassicae multiple nucleopolyhedrovirus]QNH90733.1 maco-B 90 [Mamestra configu